MYPSKVNAEATIRADGAEYAAYTRAAANFQRFNDRLPPQLTNSRQYAAVEHDVSPALTIRQSNQQRRVFNATNEEATDPHQRQQQQWLGDVERASRHGVRGECTSLTECPQAEEVVKLRVARSQLDEGAPPANVTISQYGTYKAGREGVSEAEHIYRGERIVRGAGPNRFVGISDMDTPITVAPRPVGDFSRVLD